MSEKKKSMIVIPRTLVYACTLIVGVLVATAFGLCFGLSYLLDFVSNAMIFGVIFIAVYNVLDKIERQRFRLTWQYWAMIAFVLASDWLFLFLSRSETITSLKIRALLFAFGVLCAVVYAYVVYAPSQKKLMEELKEETVIAITAVLNDITYITQEDKAHAIVDAIFAPKKKADAVEEKKEA